MRSPSPCRLAALGMINSLGGAPSEIWPRVLAADQSSFRRRGDLVPGRELLVAEVTARLPELPSELHRYACRNNALLMAAAEQLMKAVGKAAARFGPDRIGVVIGSSTSGVGDAEKAIAHQHASGQLGEAFHYEQLEFGGAARFVAELFGVGGPSYAISTACSSGARALATARSLIALGACDAVVAGAADTLCGLTANGFSALRVVSDDVCNPCSANRSGLTLGEGAALFLVTGDEGGVQLLGVGESTEAHHMSTPDPEGVGAEQSMLVALRDAGLSPEEIAYLNLHGTGTSLNDAMECTAVARVFPDPPPCSSSKSLVGHLLGAAGAVEAGLCWLALDRADAGAMDLPPHAFDGDLDPAFGDMRLALPGMRSQLGPVMSNSFGFGGKNCTLILARAMT
jgi:3-oxoacyl-[acyl-carrier-protein] synthase-1